MKNISFKYSNRVHNLFFLFLTCILIGFSYTGISLAETSTNIFCLFLILTIGMSHGSLDNLKGNKILKTYKIKDGYIFYLTYILIAIFIATLWLFAPSFTLIFFLVVASYHFGKEDSYIYYPLGEQTGPIFIHKKLDNLSFILKGSIVILAPLAFHFEETLIIFEILFVDNINFLNILIYCDKNNIFKIAFIVSAIFGLGWFIETVCIATLNYFFSPIVAFTVYFCFLHSVRHIVSLIIELKNEKEKVEKKLRKWTQIDKSNIKMFIKKSLPLTLTTAVIFILGVFLLTSFYNINDAILKVIFIGLASLTFPHILLEYLLEKNEK